MESKLIRLKEEIIKQGIFKDPKMKLLIGSTSVKQPTLILDLAFAPKGTQAPEGCGLPDRDTTEKVLIEKALQPFLAEAATERKREAETILRHIEISLNELINRQQLRFGDLTEQQQQGDSSSPVAANLKQVEDRLDELNGRLEGRRAELAQERQAMIGDIQFVGRAWVLPHPDRTKPEIAPMVRDDEIERLAVNFVRKHEEQRGCVVESVEAENRGFDLISRRFDPNDPKTCVEIRFIEVKGRSVVGEIALTTYEYKTAERLKNDYWLYVVFNCGTKPDLQIVQDPVRLGWKPIVKIEHYHVGAKEILSAATNP